MEAGDSFILNGGEQVKRTPKLLWEADGSDQDEESREVPGCSHSDGQVELLSGVRWQYHLDRGGHLPGGDLRVPGEGGGRLCGGRVELPRERWEEGEHGEGE